MLADKIYSAFQGKRVAIWGLGREGLSSLSFLREQGHTEIGVYDTNRERFAELPAGVLPLAGPAELNDFDLILKSPGISLDDFPEVDLGRITSQTEVFLEALRGQVIGVTGTKGKSTTATLLYHILREHRSNTVLVGNIGIPCWDMLGEIDADTAIVFELSCHQLARIRHSPHIGVLLNIYQDHLDYYKTMERYTAIKENIFRFQREGDVLVVSERCGEQIALAKQGAGKVVTAAEQGARGDIHLEQRRITTPAGSITIAEDGTSLIGAHNLSNISIAYYICHDLYGVPDAAFARALRTYTGLPHRLQYIGTLEGVSYYDDSISTVPETAIAAMRSLGNVGSILIGGMDRGIAYESLAAYLAASEVGHIILLPNTAERIHRLLRQSGSRQLVHPVKDLEQAVAVAKRVTPKGKACLLSPAAASYGFFKNFEERGDEFRKLVFSTKKKRG